MQLIIDNSCQITAGFSFGGDRVSEPLGSIWTEFRLSLNRFNADCANAEARLRRSGGIIQQLSRDASDRYSRSLNNLGETMQSMGQKGMIAGTALAAGLGLAAKKSMDFTASMSRVKALSGATDSDLKEMTDTAKELGATTAFSASQAAEGMQFLAMAGYKTNEIIDAMPGLLDAAAAGQLELGKTADIVSNIMSGFGIVASDTGRIADVLTAAFTNSNTTLEMLGLTMKYVAPVAKATGLSLEEVSAAAGLLGNAGIQGEQAGTTLRAALVRLAAPAGEAKDLMESLGLSVIDQAGKMLPLADIIEQLSKKTAGMGDAQKTAALSVIFGQEAVSGMLALMDAGPQKIRDFTKELENSGGTAKRIADDQLDNLKGALTELSSAMEGMAIAIGTNLEPALKDLAKRVTGLVQGFNQLSEDTQQTVSKVAVFTTAALLGGGALLMIIGYIPRIVAGYRLLKRAVDAAKYSQLGLNLAMAVNPLTIFMIGLAALIAYLITLYKTSDTARYQILQTLSAIKYAFLTDVAVILSVLEKLLFFIPKVSASLRDMKNAAIGAMEAEKELMRIRAGDNPALVGDAWRSERAAEKKAAREATKATQDYGDTVDTVGDQVEGLGDKVDGTTEKVDKFREAMEKLSYETEMGLVSPQQELERLQQIKDAHAKTTEEIREINLALKQKQEEINRQGFEDSKKWIDDRKYYQELSLQEELAAWQRVSARYKESTEERKQADREVFRVKEELIKKEESLTKSLLETVISNGERMKEADDEYAKRKADILKELADGERRLTEQFESELQQRADALMNWVGLFDEVPEMEAVSGEELLGNLQDQVTSFEDWQKAINNLAAKGVDQGLIKELQGMGPKALPQIQALNNMTSDQLNQYVSLWQQRSQMAREQATAELQELHIETQEKIAQLRKEAADKLEQYRQDWEKTTKKIKDETINTLAQLEKDANEIGDSLVNNATKWGENLIQNMIDGMNSKMAQFEGLLLKLNTMTHDFLGFSSPTKLGPGRHADKWAPNFMKMFTQGIESWIPNLQKIMGTIAFNMDPANLAPAMAGVTNNSTTNGVWIDEVNLYGNSAEELYEGFKDLLDRDMARRGI